MGIPSLPFTSRRPFCPSDISALSDLYTLLALCLVCLINAYGGSELTFGDVVKVD
jgi:hypothetical protein